MPHGVCSTTSGGRPPWSWSWSAGRLPPFVVVAVAPSVRRPVRTQICPSVDRWSYVRRFPANQPNRGIGTTLQSNTSTRGVGVASNLDHDHERRRPTKIFPYTSKLATPPVEIASPTQPSSYHDEIKHLPKEAKEISYRPHSR